MSIPLSLIHIYGATYQPWPGSVPLSTLGAGGSRTVLLRGTVNAQATGTIVNTAVAVSYTHLRGGGKSLGGQRHRQKTAGGYSPEAGAPGGLVHQQGARGGWALP